MMLNWWRSGQTKRYHTHPTIGQQNVAEHSWGVAMILLKFFPDCSKPLLEAALKHDMAERWTGDIPYPVKKASGAIKLELEALEALAEQKYNINIPFLTTNEQNLLKLADILELCIYCYDQLLLGNHRLKSCFFAGIHIAIGIVQWGEGCKEPDISAGMQEAKLFINKLERFYDRRYK